MSTINDVSRLAGVSKATVSRVLSGSRGVKEASRLAVLRAVDELNYRPNVIAQSLLSQSTGCIGVICAMDNINQTTGYLYALEKQFSQHQKHLLLRFANTRLGVMSALDELSSGLCDDVLIIGARFPLEVESENVVLIDCPEADTANSIQFDHVFAAETACNYLASQGRRQIALIQPFGSGFADDVLLGYKHGLEKNFLPFNRNLVFMDSIVYGGVAGATQQRQPCQLQCAAGGRRTRGAAGDPTAAGFQQTGTGRRDGIQPRRFAASAWHPDHSGD